MARQIGLGPAQQSARCLDLSCRDQLRPPELIEILLTRLVTCINRNSINSIFDGWDTIAFRLRNAFTTRNNRSKRRIQMVQLAHGQQSYVNRRSFIGGSDARIIMGSDEAALVQLWREKRGEAEPEDLSGNLIVQLGRATEELNRSWYERNTGRQVRDVQRRVRHSAIAWM